MKVELSAGADVNALAISPDLNMLAVAPAERPAQLWDLRLGKVVANLPTRFSGSLALDFSPDGKWLASADADTGIRFYEASTGAPRASNNDFLLETFAAAFSTDSKHLYVGGADKTISEIDAITGKVVRSFPKQTFVVRVLDASPDGKSLVAAYADERSFDNPAPVMVWDLATQAVRTTVLQDNVHPNGGGFLPDGRLLLTSNGAGKLEVWSVK
jgi:WD40 repeat protein